MLIMRNHGRPIRGIDRKMCNLVSSVVKKRKGREKKSLIGAQVLRIYGDKPHPGCLLRLVQMAQGTTVLFVNTINL